MYCLGNHGAILSHLAKESFLETFPVIAVNHWLLFFFFFSQTLHICKIERFASWPFIIVRRRHKVVFEGTVRFASFQSSLIAHREL